MYRLFSHVYVIHTVVALLGMSVGVGIGASGAQAMRTDDPNWLTCSKKQDPATITLGLCLDCCVNANGGTQTDPTNLRCASCCYNGGPQPGGSCQ